MLDAKITRQDFEKILQEICARETSSNPNDWQSSNPLYGHCAVVSLLAQDLFGGGLLRASLEDIPQFKAMGSHYVNEFEEGAFDFTRNQFRENYPTNLNFEERSRKYVLYDPKTGEPRQIMGRYKTLALKFLKKVFSENPLLNDPVYQECFYAALESECQKMKFGVVVVHKDRIVYRGANKIIPGLEYMCDPKCIRLGIQSRTESMIGACGHGEERAIWGVAKQGIPLSKCELYVAGFFPDNTPWERKRPEHTCLRCAVQMHNSELGRLYVPFEGKWVGISTEEALKTAATYALQEKKV